MPLEDIELAPESASDDDVNDDFDIEATQHVPQTQGYESVKPDILDVLMFGDPADIDYYIDYCNMMDDTSDGGEEKPKVKPSEPPKTPILDALIFGNPADV